jgi:hypothetical protein
MFQLNGGGEELEKQKQYFIEQMDAAKNDLLTRLEFTYLAMHGKLDDDLDGMDIKWKHLPRTPLSTTSSTPQ